MFVEIPKEYLSTFNRQLQTQLYNELMHDYSFPRAVCRALSELFIFYFDLYFSSQRKKARSSSTQFLKTSHLAYQ